MAYDVCSEHPLFGGLSLDQARELHAQALSVTWARKNLFHVTIESPVPIIDERIFNLYCIGVDFSPITISGEKRKIGAVSADSVNAIETGDLHMTTLDDVNGTLQNWFNELCHRAASSDGTVSPPIYYATRITIRQAFVDGQRGALLTSRLFRPNGIEIGLSRTDQAMQELSLSFIALDGFMPSIVVR